MSQHLSFRGKRADGHVVTGIHVGKGQRGDGPIRHGVVKEVEYYTLTCPDDDCDGEGYYNDIGEVICENCSIVISGDDQPKLQTETHTGEGHGQGRGMEVMRNHNQLGTHQPSI